MKKIWKEINRIVYLKWYVGISTVMAVLFSWTEQFNWWESAVYGLIFFTLITSLAFVNNIQEEKRVKFLDDRHKDDPEWKKYKELKKKFNNS